MRIKILATAIMLTAIAFPVWAEEKNTHLADHQHGAEIWHAFVLEADYGGGQSGPVWGWDFDGWIGTDENKLWLKSEGENEGGTTDKAEFWTMYSRNVHDFWDLQAGIRHDFQSQSTSYAVVGINGLAPYFFETEAHLFLSDDGDVSARIRQENEFLLTQRLILSPYAEINLFAQDVPELDIGAGLSSGDIGLQTRYEVTRKFAPYVDFRYERKFGETSSIAKNEGEDNDDFIAGLGVRVMF